MAATTSARPPTDFVIWRPIPLSAACWLGPPERGWAAREVLGTARILWSIRNDAAPADHFADIIACAVRGIARPDARTLEQVKYH